MKANKAFEKIYLEAIYPDNGVLPGGLHYTPSPTDIEYIRTDVLIKKAENYLKSKFINDVSILAGGSVNIGFSTAIKNFVNYIKGE